MKQIKFFTLSLFCFFNIYASQDSLSTELNSLYFQVQRVHCDITSTFFVNDITFSSDCEIYRTSLQSFGIQVGYSYLTAGDFGGSKYGSPFQDYNFLGYTSIGYDKIITTQLLLGYSYRISGNTYAKEYPVGGLKYGADFIFNISKSIKLNLKLIGVSNSTDYHTSSAGLGVSFGWER
jgi:hypothetical protein